ncbi:MAG: GtrA family protein [Clostridiales bacterium]|nr:GtrA family protein [Clostridiales bacterium]
MSKWRYNSIFNMTLLKFFIVGVINTALGMGIMMIMYNVFHCSYWVSTASNYIITSVIAFFVNRRITFKSKERSILQGLKFTANIVTCYLIAYGVARPLTARVLSRTGTRMVTNIAMLVGMGLFSTMNYLGQRFLVFPEKKGKS